MALYAFHRILIVFAILFDFAFTWYCIRKYNRSGDVWEILFAAAASALTIGFVTYLVYFNRKTADLRLTLAAQNHMCPACNYDLRGSLAADVTACPECGAPITEDFRRKAALG